MKFRALIIISFFATAFNKNAKSVRQGGERPKLNITFDEIFGKGWDDESNCRHVKEEVQDGQAPNTSDQKNIDEILKQKFDEIYGENWSEDDNEFIEEAEADSTDQNNCIDGQKCQKVQENGTKVIKRRKNDYSDQQKREIVEYISLTEKFMQKGKHSRKERTQNYNQIAKCLCVGINTIWKWKKEFGLSRSIKLHSKQEKMEKLKQYYEIKRNNPKIKNSEIAESLNIGGSTLRQWKREQKNAVRDEKNCSLQKELDQITQPKVYSDQEKLEILKQFDEIKRKCKKTKLKNILMRELDEKIAKKLGVSTATIVVWKRKFGLSVNKKISDATKIEILKKYAKIKGKNPKMKEVEIAESLNIGGSTLKQWKSELKNAVKDENDCSLQKELDQIAQDKVYSDQQKSQILKQFVEIKSKCKKAKLKNISMRELDDKIAKKLGVCRYIIYEWKRKFGLSVSNKISDATKIGILKKYANIKEKNPKMRDCQIADLLKISGSNLCNWKKQFQDEIKNL